jgi:Cu-processing system permease protein
MLQIAWITLRRITERAVLIQFGILALVLAYVALGIESVIMLDAASSEQSGLGVTWLFLTVFTIFWSTIEIPREVGRKEAHVYLAKPMSRLQYLLGKYFGMTSMVLAGETILLLIFSGCLLIKGHKPSEAFLFGAVKLGLFLALLNALCAAASVILSEVPAMVAVLFVAGAASVVCAVAVMAWASYDPWTGRALALAYYIVPNLLHYRWEPAGSMLAYAGALAIYTAGWSSLCLLIAWALFVRQDLP